MIKDTVASIYAKTLFEITEEDGQTDVILYQLLKLEEKLSKEISIFLDGKLISKNERISLLNEFEKNGLDQLIVNMLKNLIMREQVGNFDLIVTKFSKLYQEKLGIKIIEVKSARKLSSFNFDYIHKELEKQLSAFVVINPIVEVDLIGGVLINYEGKTIDNTIKKHLRDLQSQTLGV